MSVLRASPFLLPLSSDVYAKVQARNEYDFSALSPASTAGA